MNFWSWLYKQIHSPGDLCWGISNEDKVVSYNPCLRGPYSIPQGIGTIQTVPDGWQLHSNLANADGVEDDFAAHARIYAYEDSLGLTFHLHNNVVGITGSWGYSQSINLEPGCYLLKVSGHGWINDTRQENNFVLNGYLDDVLISQQPIPHQEEFQLIYPFEIVVDANYTVKFMLQSLWATAGHSSQVDITSAAVLTVDDGFCK